MTILTEEMKEIFTKVKVFAVGTASKAGIPNVAPMATVMLHGEDTIWIGDNYMCKTLENLKENPVMALYAWDPASKQCLQIKGEVTIRTEGALKVTGVFTCVPGKDAGKKLA